MDSIFAIKQTPNFKLHKSLTYNVSKIKKDEDFGLKVWKKNPQNFLFYHKAVTQKYKHCPRKLDLKEEVR